jgi:hypothetical protein
MYKQTLLAVAFLFSAPLWAHAETFRIAGYSPPGQIGNAEILYAVCADPKVGICAEYDLTLQLQRDHQFMAGLVANEHDPQDGYHATLWEAPMLEEIGKGMCTTALFSHGKYLTARFVVKQGTAIKDVRRIAMSGPHGKVFNTWKRVIESHLLPGEENPFAEGAKNPFVMVKGGGAKKHLDFLHSGDADGAYLTSPWDKVAETIYGYRALPYEKAHKEGEPLKVLYYTVLATCTQVVHNKSLYQQFVGALAETLTFVKDPANAAEVKRVIAAGIRVGAVIDGENRARLEAGEKPLDKSKLTQEVVEDMYQTFFDALPESGRAPDAAVEEGFRLEFDDGSEADAAIAKWQELVQKGNTPFFEFVQ